MADKKNSAADEAVRRALETAKKTAAKKSTKSDDDDKKGSRITQEELRAATKKNALPYRVAAVILWLAAIGFEIMAILVFTLKVQFPFTVENPGYTITWIACLVLDLICVAIGSLLWKKGNHLDPGSKKNKVGFWLRNNFGVIMAALAFIPFIIFALTDKKASKQSKIIAVIAGVAGLLIATLFGIDYHPLSSEDLNLSDVYWTENGVVYHADRECQYIKDKPDSDVKNGSSDESGKARLCKVCEEKAEKAGEALHSSSDAEKSAGTNTEALTSEIDKSETAADVTSEESQVELTPGA